MSMLKSVILKEESRNEKMIVEYTKELNKLPKGSIVPKKINEKTYYYLYFRNGKKVFSKYIGKDINEINKIRELLTRRNQIEDIIKQLKEEKKQIKKMEELL